ncbi:carbohydrate binding domain-containing protein [Bifidobacterium animalis]|uniref:carbohydrate binding domain-containing protein n=1 Tax=Bifidobacterium animalis TaxID=28025 RepID=UPI003F8ED681
MADESANTINISDTKATDETRALFANLRDTKAGDVRFGQQHATDEAISETATQGDVYEMTGKYPAVFGWDAGLVLEGREKPGSGSDQGANAKALAAEITKADELGAIVTLSAHWSNPKTGGNYDDTTRVVGDLLPGGAYSGRFNSMLDGIAAVAEQSKRADGTQIPIIFRPLHENTGNWFWWGATHATADEYKELFRYTVNYLRDIKGVHNFLYAYSPGGTLDGDANAYLKTYPGDNYVDVLGYDTYDRDNSKDDASAWLEPVMKDMKMLNDQATERGKIVAFTEFGRSDDRGFKKDVETKDKQFFTELRDAITKDAPNTAYMMTWANFGGSGSNFQAYTPWKGQDAEPEFAEFANSSDKLMASPANVDFSNAPAAAAQSGTARIVTPVNGDRVNKNTIGIRVKVDDVNMGKVKFDNTDKAPYVISNGIVTDRKDANGNFVTVPLTYTCNGYLTGTLDLDKAGIALDNGKLRLTPQIALNNGTLLKSPDGTDGTIEIKLGEADAVPENVIDDFDSYDNDDELNSAYSPNNGKSSFFTLVASPQGEDAGNAVNLHYDYNANPGYTGYARSFDPKRDWSKYTGISMYYKPDGSRHKLVIQMNANGVTFEAYPSLEGTDAQVIDLPFDNPVVWNVASWDTTNAGKTPDQKLLSKVGSFAIYVNDNDNELQDNAGRPRTGDLVFDSIELVGERDPYVPEEPSEPSNAKPITIDDFESYADDAAMKEAWGNREHTDVLSLATEDDGNKYLQYSNPNGGWLDVATFIQNDTARNNWTGEEKLTFRLKNNGSNNAMAIQIGTADGKYFHVDQKLDSAMPEGWNNIEIDLVDNPSLTQSWPEDENKGKTMTADDLAVIKEIVVAGNTWNNDSPAVEFGIDDMKVVPAQAKPITLDTFDSYADEAAMKEAWGNRKHTEVLSLGEEDGNKFLQYSNPNGGWLDVATFIQNDETRNNWTGLGKLTFRLKHDGSNNAMALQIGTADGKYFHVDQKLAAEDDTDWKTVEIDLVDNPSLTQSWPEDENKGKTMTADDLAVIKEIVVAGNTWNNDSPAVNFAVDDLKVVPSGDASDTKPETKPEEPSEPAEPTEPEETPDYSADIADGDPATCPITFEQVPVEDPADPSDPATETNKPVTDDKNQSDNKDQSNAKADENESVANTGSSVAVVAAVAVALVLAGAATLVWARQRRQR